MQAYKKQFFDLSLAKGILRFGSFTLKSGRLSPYFFNAGGFDDGQSLSQVARCYAQAIKASGISFDLLFGPAYKGIPLASATAMAIYDLYGSAMPYAYNRKEIKDHGEGGALVGAPLAGKVLIIDDVISAGTSVRESVSLIRQAGAEPSGVAIALDRQERGQGLQSAAEEVEAQFDIPVIAVGTLSDLVSYLELHDNGQVDIKAIRRYRREYGTAGAQ
ncbi:MAG: orotate phosphoribosyltransferase [Xanthomonadales bacterium]|nr:orotate phosphoribosyltransferase [Gammaproteobacteria bacterium]NNE05698.1 orotate phosphoribosyltransferase [Xanthomonadales bacterium]NNL96152.1 orotate phosphoribosyltransferase [Xanthomonadales bacterium]